MAEEQVYKIVVTPSQLNWIEYGLHGGYMSLHATRVHLTAEQIDGAVEYLWAEKEEILGDAMYEHIDWGGDYPSEEQRRRFDWIEAQKRKSLDLTIEKLSRKAEEIGR